MTEGGDVCRVGLFSTLKLDSVFLIDFTYLDLKNKNDEKTDLLFHQWRRVTFQRRNLTPYVMIYFTFQDLKKGLAFNFNREGDGHF